MLLHLLALHALCDYPLQGDFMAKAKNHRTGFDWAPWWIVMAAHALIHAGAVALVAPLWCALGEFVTHFALDYAKNEGWLGSGSGAFTRDQLGHVFLKVLYWVLA